MRRTTRGTTRDSTIKTVTVTLWRRLQEGGFILLTALSIFLLVALVTYSETDPGWSKTASRATIGNAAGGLGAWFSDLFLTLFGYISYLFPTIISYGGIRLFQNRFEISVFNRLLWILRVLGFLLAVISGCGLATLHFNLWAEGIPYTAGGILGQVVAQQLIPILGKLGTTLVAMALFLAGITLTTGLSWFGLMDSIGSKLINGLLMLRACIPMMGTHIKHRYFQWKEKRKERSLAVMVPLAKKKRVEPLLASQPNRPSSADRAVVKSETANCLDEPLFKPSMNVKMGSSSAKLANGLGTSQAKLLHKDINGLPSVTLLEPAEDSSKFRSFSPQKLEALSREVEARLLEFNVQVMVVGVYPGPVITRFELELAAGVKVSKITGLSKDLARALSVTRVRVVEVIPGKSVVGLEIPNEHRELVRLREIFESSAYQESTSPLTMALGKDISGEPEVVNLAKMPHLLVAGTTGSGKSVGVNVMLLSLLFKATPAEVRLILIDPKMLELSIYDGIPHLLTPVVTDMKDAANVLRWCVSEMDRRYQIMAALGVRNLVGYNRKTEDAESAGAPLMNPLWRPEMGGEQPQLEQLPYIVVIIDEFADMIMVVGKKVEELIARIAQKARAAGIHMILATQRPSVDVITGLIKANVPTRIAYQVSSRIDSRTILDQQGAEQLLGHGDMLFLSPGAGIPTRIHGAFVSDEEVHAVVKAIKQMGEPDYAEDILGGGGTSVPSLGWGVGGSDEEGSGEHDDLYDQAAQIVIETRRTSISHLQRRLKVGYNRAARLIESMELAGILSPMQSNGVREVLVGASIEE
jgi:S-DNA-T family DNA segregation ATPase FtsK/SpoIIIE